MERMRLEIDGMSCGHCVAAVMKSLQAVDGVTPISVHVGSADIEYDPARAKPDAVVAAVGDAGYMARVTSP